MAKKNKSQGRESVLKNGSLTIGQFLWLIENDKLDWLVRNRNNTIRGYCPPPELIDKTSSRCFYCEECYRECQKIVKNNKISFKIGRDKYNKDELNVPEDIMFGKGFFTKQEPTLMKGSKRKK